MLERKPQNMVFQFCLEISNSLRLLSFFNSKLKTQNSKPCLNGVFVQALIMDVPHVIPRPSIGRIQYLCVMGFMLRRERAYVKKWQQDWTINQTCTIGCNRGGEAVSSGGNKCQVLKLKSFSAKINPLTDIVSQRGISQHR